MQTLTTWAPPVAVSLLLHAALIALVTYKMSLTQTGKIHESAITLTLQAQAPNNENKPPVKVVKPVLKTSTPQQTSTTNPAPVEPAATSEPTTAASQENQATAEPRQASMTIHPLNKLSRPPAFLQKIEPVYPTAERRAGSQANVLAEVTIDEQGKVHEARIVKSAGAEFDNAVLQALKKSVFVPGYIGNEAVATRVFVPFRFNLK